MYLHDNFSESSPVKFRAYQMRRHIAISISTSSRSCSYLSKLSRGGGVGFAVQKTGFTCRYDYIIGSNIVVAQHGYEALACLLAEGASWCHLPRTAEVVPYHPGYARATTLSS